MEAPARSAFHRQDSRGYIKGGCAIGVSSSFYKTKLHALSRDLYHEHDWRMPNGFVDRSMRDPRNFSIAEWQQAKRSKHDPKMLKGLFQDCWAISDDRKSFERALEERGFHLAKGDRRGFVAIDYKGEPYAVSKYVGKKAKEVRERLGKPDDLRSVAETRQHIANQMTDQLRRYIDQAEAKMQKDRARLDLERAQSKQRDQAARTQLRQQQETRQAQEARIRAERFRKGVRGLWDRLSGHHGRIKQQNELEAYEALKRDQRERDGLIEKQLGQRQALQTRIREARQRHARQLLDLNRDMARYRKLGRIEEPQKERAKPAPEPERKRVRQRPVRPEPKRVPAPKPVPQRTPEPKPQEAQELSAKEAYLKKRRAERERSRQRQHDHQHSPGHSHDFDI